MSLFVDADGRRMFIFAAILNILCINGYTKFVWFIVIIPIILLTYISSVLFYVFGINPGKTDVRVQKKQAAAPEAPGATPPPPPPQPAASGPAAAGPTPPGPRM